MLKEIIRKNLNLLADDVSMNVITMRSLTSGRPNPTYRFDWVVPKS